MFIFGQAVWKVRVQPVYYDAVLAEHVYSQGLAHTHESDNTITSCAIPLLRASGYEPGDALLALQISSQSVQAISSLDPLIHFSSNPPALRPDSFLAESDKQPLAAPSACLVFRRYPRSQKVNFSALPKAAIQLFGAANFISPHWLIRTRKLGISISASVYES